MKRKNIAKNHLLSGRRLGRKIYVPVLGWMEGILFIFSLVVGKNLVGELDSFYRAIPVIGFILAPPNDNSVTEEDVEEIADNEIEKEEVDSESNGGGGFLDGIFSGTSGVKDEFEVSVGGRSYTVIYDPISNTVEGKNIDLTDISGGRRTFRMEKVSGKKENVMVGRTGDNEWEVRRGLEDFGTSNSGSSSGIADKVPGLGGGSGGGGKLGFLKSKKGIALILILFLVLGGGSFRLGLGGSALGLVMNPIGMGLMTVLFLFIFFIAGGTSSVGNGIKNHPMAMTSLMGIGGLIFLFVVLPGVSEAADDSPLGQYGDYVTQGVEQRTGGISLERPAFIMGEQVRKVQCAMQGPHCLREWRLNNTREPDSRDVGETYGLQINSFGLDSGDSLDIRGLEKEHPIPLEYTVNNIRHGHKGIDARNVKFRVTITDHEHDNDIPYCDTGWRDIDGLDMEQYSGDNHLPPGFAASVGSARITDQYFIGISEDQQLTLDNCNLLSPGAGMDVSPEFHIRYDYSSQATLNFEAVSQEYARSQNIEVDQKNSETADTPVQAALAVQEPVLFDPDNRDNDFPVDMSATLVTDDHDLRYQVLDLELEKPEKTELFDENERFCSFEEGDGENVLELESDSKDRIFAHQMDNPIWFGAAQPAPNFGCDLKLDEDESFNPSGETLTADVRANYTVQTSESIATFFSGGFEVFRSDCTRLNCPLIVALNEIGEREEAGINREELVMDLDAAKEFGGSEEAYWNRNRAMCEGLDAGDGCTAKTEYDPDIGQGEGTEIERGEIAINLHEGLRESIFTCEVNEGVEESAWGIEGFDPDELVEAIDGLQELHYDGGWTFVDTGEIECEDENEEESGSDDDEGAVHEHEQASQYS